MGSFSDNRQVKRARDLNLDKLCANTMRIICTKIEAHGANDVSLTRRANKGVTYRRYTPCILSQATLSLAQPTVYAPPEK